MSDVQFCVRPDCVKIAVGTGRWKPRRGANPYAPDEPYCRSHHLERVAGRVQRCRVVGPLGIVDALTGETVHRGGVVSLDPAETHIAALVAGELVEVLPAETPASKKA